MTVRPVARRARSSSSSVREAEATLWAGTSNFSRKATASVSHGEANQSMPRFLQYSSIGAVLVLAELHAVAVVDVGHPAPGGVALDVPLVARGADLRGALLELDRVAAGLGGGVDEREGVLEVAVVVDADLAGDVDGLAGAGGAGRRRCGGGSCDGHWWRRSLLVEGVERGAEDPAGDLADRAVASGRRR